MPKLFPIFYDIRFVRFFPLSPFITNYVQVKFILFSIHVLLAFHPNQHH